MNTWFRVYNTLVDDPKAQMLPDNLFRALVNLWCVASQNDGIIPTAADVAFKLRMTTARAAEIVTKLHMAGLLDKVDGGGFTPHHWAKRQFISDVSTARVKRYREKRVAAGLPATWTCPKPLRIAVYARDEHQCVYCDAVDDLSVDHRTPQSRGGTDDLENLQTLCRPCNAAKRDMTHDEYVARNGGETFQKRPRTEQTKTKQNTAERRAAVSHETKGEQSDIVVRMLKTDLMEVFGESRCPDLARASDWIARGYAPSMCVDVVRELLARKPDIASLAYCDAAIAERHAKRAATPSERAAGLSEASMDWAVAHFAKGGHWPRSAGAEPGMHGCKASPELLAKYGLGKDGQKLRVDA